MNNLSPNNSNKNEIKPKMELFKEISTMINNGSFTKKNTMEYDNPFSKEISSSFQDNYNGSNIKKSSNFEEKENENLNYNFSNNKNRFEESDKKHIYNSYNSKNSKLDENPKISLNKNSSLFSNNEIKFSLNNTKNLKKNQAIINSELITEYKLWKGYNYFPLKAHIIEGPCSFRPTLMTACAMTIPTILFFIFNSEYLTDKMTIIIPIIVGVLYLISFIYLIIATFCDPGIIRRFDLKKDNKSKDYIKSNTFNDFKRNDSRIFHLGYITNFKFCPSCGIIRPCRSTHCSDCNNCVERLDHHCPWIGNCAGKRNYIYFFIFLILLNFLTILIIIFCVLHIIFKVNDYKDLNDELPEENKIDHITAHSFCEVIISLYLIIYCIITMCFITGLLFYHSRLVLTNSTTKEELRKLFYNCQGNPYRRNICRNIGNVLCPKKKKYSILDILRGDVKEICDKKDKNFNHNNKLSDFGNENETNIKLNIESSIISNLNNESKSKIYNNPSEYKTSQEVINTEDQNDLNENSLFNEPQDTNINIRKSHSFKMEKNTKLEQYLKYFGTGIKSNINK